MYQCDICGYPWEGKVVSPCECPKCKSCDWNKVEREAKKQGMQNQNFNLSIG